MFYCFGDFEFTCGRKIDKESRELLSSGIVIYDSGFQEVIRYYKTAKPVRSPKLSNFCVQLTGLTQNEIDSSRDSEFIFTDILKLIEQYNIDSVYVMGSNDERNLCEDDLIHKEFHINQKHNGSELAAHIVDIQAMLKKSSNIKTREAIGIQKYLDFYDITVEGSLHNSLTDALALAAIYKKLVFKKDNKKTDKIVSYEEEMKRKEEEIARLRLERQKELENQK